jgi:hypothetical protein
VPDERTGPLVRQAFELFSTGQYSLARLSEVMFSRGFATRFGRMYSAENIKQLLSREFYIGRIIWHDKVYQGKHEPLVAKPLFYRVQTVLKQRSADTGEKGRRQFLLRGIAHCAVCGHRLTGEVHPRGTYYLCVPQIDKERCKQPYSAVPLLDQQLSRLYEALRLPPGFVALLKAELEAIVNRRERLAKREVGGLKRVVEEIEQKEIRLLDEMLGGAVARDVYEKIARTYREKRQQAETRLSQVDVNSDDPIQFVEGCAKVASLLGNLHRQFGFEQQKNLLRAVFARIDVRDRTIVDVQFNPPFSFFFDDIARTLFKDRPVEATEQEVFEQIMRFTLSSEFALTKQSLESLMQACMKKRA